MSSRRKVRYGSKARPAAVIKKAEMNSFKAVEVASKRPSISPLPVYLILLFAIMYLASLIHFDKLDCRYHEISKNVGRGRLSAKTIYTKKRSSVPKRPKFKPDFTLPLVENNLAPIVYKVPTSQNVVYLSIDDGAFKDQSVIDIMRENNIKASLYLSKAFIASDPQFFKQLVDLGSVIENHTMSHDLNMSKVQGYDQQKAEICGMADYIAEQYGKRPVFYRPPGGAYTETMRRAAAECGMKAVVTWVVTVGGGAVHYQVGDSLHAGDVVLMHFRPEFVDDMKAFINAMNAAGLHTELLEDAL